MTKLLAMAVRSFGGHEDGVSNSANFAVAVMKVLGADKPPDGRVVARVLDSRADVSRLSGGCHWKWEMWG